jgi:hypothetical protein
MAYYNSNEPYQRQASNDGYNWGAVGIAAAFGLGNAAATEFGTELMYKKGLHKKIADKYGGKWGVTPDLADRLVKDSLYAKEFFAKDNPGFKDDLKVADEFIKKKTGKHIPKHVQKALGYAPTIGLKTGKGRIANYGLAVGGALLAGFASEEMMDNQ